MSELNIVTLIEQTPLVKLTEHSQHKFIEKFQEQFTDDQQKLFASSFYCYLNYDKSDFVINLNDIWKWLGFSRKSDCKKILVKHFKDEIDYSVLAISLATHYSGVSPDSKLSSKL
jgi:hypothetical protein